MSALTFSSRSAQEESKVKPDRSLFTDTRISSGTCIQQTRVRDRNPSRVTGFTLSLQSLWPKVRAAEWARVYM